MAVNTQEQFFEALAATKLLSEQRLAKAKEAAQGKTEPTAIARVLVYKGLLSRWQAAQILSEKFPSYLGKYRLLDMLESGDVGAVYLAEHEQMNRRVFLKTVTRKKGDNGESVQDFLKDARSISTLDHRNLIHVFDVDKEDSSFYLVMEHVDGEDLQKIVGREGPLSFDRAASYIAQAASGLAHAHDQSIRHHGIKPDRLIVDEKGELKILDIGVARLVDPDEETTGRASNHAKPEDVDYVAPEQATGRNKVDQRADLYSLGCVFYCLLTGHAPYPEGNTEERLRTRIRKSPPSVLDERPDTPAVFVDCCAKMMATQPRERFTAAEVAERLQQWLKEHQPVRSKPARPEADKPAPRRSSSGNLQRSSGDLHRNSGELAGIAIKADPDRPGSRQSTPAKTKVRTGRESSDTPIVEPVDKKKLPLPLIIAAVSGGLALVVAIVVVAIVLGSRPAGDTPQADGNGQVAAATAAVVDAAKEKFDVLTPDDVLFGPADLRLTVIDGLCNIKGEVPDKATYTIVTKIGQEALTGFRLEELSGVENRGFAISEIEAFAAPDKSGTSASRRLRLGAASDGQRAADEVLDRNMGTGWSPASAPGAVTVMFAEPVKMADVNPGKDSYWLRIAIHQNAGGQQVIGTFRVAARTGGATPGPRPPVDLSASPTLAYWRFEDGKAGQAVQSPPVNTFQAAAGDVSNQGNHLYARDAGSAPSSSGDVDAGTVRGTGEENKLCLDTTIAPAEGQAARFLVTNPSLAKPKQDIGLMPLSAWTIEASFRISELSGRHVILCKTGQPAALSEPPFELAVDSETKQVRVTAMDQSGAKRTAQSNEQLALQAGAWYHVAAVCDGKNLRLLVDAPGDGQGYLEQGSVECSGGLIDSFGDWTIGRGWAAGEPSGSAVALIDEVRISAAALPDDQLLYHGTAEQLEAEKSAPAPTAVATTNGAGTDDTPKAEPKPKPEPKPDPKPKPADGKPFAKTAAVVGLPLIKPDEPFDEDDLLPVSLGKVSLGADDVLVVSLIGGETGHGAPGAFSLIDGEPADRPDQNNWELQYRAEGGTPTTVARLFRIAEGFAFTWKKEAEKITEANYLRNCVLKLRVGAEFHTVLLRAPVDNAPMPFFFTTDRKKKVEPLRAAIAYPPAGDVIHLEFQMSCANPDNVDFMPKHVFEPSTTPAEKGSVTMVLGDAGTLRVSLTSTWNDKDGFVEVVRQRPAYRQEGAERDQELNLAKLQSTISRFEPIVSTAPRALELVEQYKKKGPDKPEDKAKLASAKAYLGQNFRTVDPEVIAPQLAKMTAAMDFVTGIMTAMEEFNEELEAHVEMRVYALVDGTQVDLLRTTGWKAPPAEKKGES